MITFLLIAAFFSFIAGLIAATSPNLFVVLAWCVSVLLFVVAGFVWLAAQFFERD